MDPQMMQQQQMAQMQGRQSESKDSKGIVNMRQMPGTMWASIKNPENMALLKTVNRWAYFEEFLDFWFQGKKNFSLAIMALAIGILILQSQPLIGMALMAVAGKVYTTSQFQTMIANKFGKTRAVITVN